MADRTITLDKEKTYILIVEKWSIPDAQLGRVIATLRADGVKISPMVVGDVDRVKVVALDGYGETKISYEMPLEGKSA